MQVVYAPGGVRLLPTPSTAYKDCIYCIYGEIGGYRYRINRSEGKDPIISEQTYTTIVTANQEARRAIDLLTRTKSKRTKANTHAS